ncbi:MAG: hypothetical protein MHMPM18_001640 [Marteilia pararefringens]
MSSFLNSPLVIIQSSESQCTDINEPLLKKIIFSSILPSLLNSLTFPLNDSTNLSIMNYQVSSGGIIHRQHVSKKDRVANLLLSSYYLVKNIGCYQYFQIMIPRIIVDAFHSSLEITLNEFSNSQYQICEQNSDNSRGFISKLKGICSKFSSEIAMLISLLIFYPLNSMLNYNVLMIFLSQSEKNKSLQIFDNISSIYKKYGISNLYKGFLPMIIYKFSSRFIAYQIFDIFDEINDSNKSGLQTLLINQISSSFVSSFYQMSYIDSLHKFQVPNNSHWISNDNFFKEYYSKGFIGRFQALNNVNFRKRSNIFKRI